MNRFESGSLRWITNEKFFERRFTYVATATGRVRTDLFSQVDGSFSTSHIHVKKNKAEKMRSGELRT